MGGKEQNKLYTDAIYWHLIGQGYTEYQAEVESKKRMTQADKI